MRLHPDLALLVHGGVIIHYHFIIALDTSAITHPSFGPRHIITVLVAIFPWR